MAPRTVHALSLAVALMLAVAVVRRDVPAGAEPGLRALAVVPPGPAFLLSVDVASLERDAFGSALARRLLEGLGATSASCHFDPLRELTEIVVSRAPDSSDALPSDPKDVAEGGALIGSGRFAANEVVACATSRIEARGGDPARTTIGSFVSVRDRKSKGELAVRDGLFVLSDGAYLREVLDAADGHPRATSEADRTRDRLHVELRRTFGGNAPVIATLLLPPGLLERAFGAEAAGSALASVRTLAIRLTPDDGLRLGVLFGCDNTAGALKVDGFLADAKGLLGSRLRGPAGDALSRVVTERRGQQVTATLTLPKNQVKALASALGLGAPP